MSLKPALVTEIKPEKHSAKIQSWKKRFPGAPGVWNCQDVSSVSCGSYRMPVLWKAGSNCLWSGPAATRKPAARVLLATVFWTPLLGFLAEWLASLDFHCGCWPGWTVWPLSVTSVPGLFTVWRMKYFTWWFPFYVCGVNDAVFVLCVFWYIFYLCCCVSVSLLFILFPTVHRKTHFLVNLYWDNTYSDSDSYDRDLNTDWLKSAEGWVGSGVGWRSDWLM